MATIESRIDQNVAKLEARLELWSAKLKEVLAKTDVAAQQAKLDSRQQIDELKAGLELAQSKLKKAKEAGGEKWSTFKDDVERTWEDLEAAFKKITA